MIRRISHIGIAVKHLGLSSEVFSRLMGTPAPRTEEVREQRASIAFYPVGESMIELVQPTGEGSGLSKFLEKRGEGMHHLCLEVDDIENEMHRLKLLGFEFIDEHPSQGGDGCLVAFIHPRSAGGVLIELSQPASHH